MGPITLSGFIGSFDYASPEQLNEEPLEVSSDIYSLGVTLWFLLTGRRPFRGPQVRVMSAHLHEAPPFDELAEFPSPSSSLLAHMLEKDPGRRPATPAELVAEIKQLSRRAEAAPRVRRRARFRSRSCPPQPVGVQEDFTRPRTSEGTFAAPVRPGGD